MSLHRKEKLSNFKMFLLSRVNLYETTKTSQNYLNFAPVQIIFLIVTIILIVLSCAALMLIINIFYSLTTIMSVVSCRIWFYGAVFICVSYLRLPDRIKAKFKVENSYFQVYMAQLSKTSVTQPQ